MPNKTESLNKKLNENKKSKSTSLVFPSDLETTGHKNSIMFTIYVRDGSAFTGKYYNFSDEGGARYMQGKSSSIQKYRLFSGVNRIDTSVTLFVPGTVNYNSNASWKTTELGTAGALIAAGASITDLSLSQNWEIAKDVLAEGTVNTIAKAVQALTPLNIADAVEIVKGSISNPYMEVMFEGVGNRSFSFSFSMVPRSAKEAETIKKICDTFKFHQAPEYKYSNHSTYWLYPSVFDITFLRGGSENPWMGKISTCALTGVEITKGGEGEFAVFENGSPVKTTLTLSFTELEVMTKNRLASFGEV